MAQVQEDSFPTRIEFPAGPMVIKTRASKAQLQDSAIAWLRLAQNQMGSVSYWAEAGDRTHETLASLKTLSSYLDHAQRALREAELAK